MCGELVKQRVSAREKNLLYFDHFLILNLTKANWSANYVAQPKTEDNRPQHAVHVADPVKTYVLPQMTKQLSRRMICLEWLMMY